MSLLVDREAGRRRRHRRLRKKVVGIAERPRLSVYRRHKHLAAQLVDDMAGKTLRGWSTAEQRSKDGGGNVKAAEALGARMAADLTGAGIRQIVFDRGGYLYHGRVKALADALRAGGIQV
jgi:large subunit ribosomal protein L18